MAQNLKRMISMINKGKDLDVCLKQYAETLGQVYYNNSLIHLFLSYYLLYEHMEDGQMDEGQEAALDAIRRTIDLLFREEGEHSRLEAVEILSQIRKSVIHRMDVLTAYADRLQICEYLMNRMEYSFADEVTVEDDAAFTQKLLQFMFSFEDKAIVTQTIQEVVGQLPIRMARSRFFDILKGSMNLLKDGDKGSLKKYQYMLETSAGVYEPEYSGEYFTDIRTQIDRFVSTDYDSLTEEAFGELSEEFTELVKRMVVVSDGYMLIQEVLNPLYAYAMALPYAKETEEEKAIKERIGFISTLFEEGAPQMPDGADDAEEELDGKLDELDEQLEDIEGQQEALIEQQQILEAVLEQIPLSYKEQAEQLGLSDTFSDFLTISKLFSSSIFIDLEKEEDMRPVEPEDIRQAQDELIEKLSGLFKESKIRYVRSVIANTIVNVPIFFSNSDEVEEYIVQSLAQCHDLSEKRVSMELIEQMYGLD